MAYAIRSGRGYRANADLAFHVLDIMEAILESAREGRHIEVGSSCQRPAPLPMGMPDYVLED
jgi:hypothetical protein